MYLFFLLLFSSVVSSEISSRDCRCVPGDDCWPSQDSWAAFNVTVKGRLSIPLSPVQPCLDEGGQSIKCKEALKSIGEDPFWLEQFPGATQSTGMIMMFNHCILFLANDKKTNFNGISFNWNY